MITGTQLKGRLAELLEVPKKQADDILWALEQVVVESVKSGEGVIIPGVGKLTCQVRAPRRAFNPKTREPLNVPAKIALKFKVEKGLESNAPSLKSKRGKALLEEAEKAKAKREKARRKRERELAANGDNKKATSKKKSAKKSGKVKAKARY